MVKMLLKILYITLLYNCMVGSIQSLIWDNGFTKFPYPEDYSSTEYLREPPNQCPENQSLISETDLNNTISTISAHLKVYYLINDSYYNDATAARDSIATDFSKFLEDVQDRPRHLQHILDDIAAKQDEMQPMIIEILTMLKKYPELENTYNAQLSVVSKLEKTLDIQRSICAQTCGHSDPPNSVLSRIAMQDHPRSYCISVADLFDTIPKKLLAFVDDYTHELTHRIANYESKYKQKLINFESKFKELALQKFGKTMYDILHLQDDMYHYSKDINSINLDDVVAEILQYFSQIGPLSQILNINLTKYAKYCRNCNNSQIDIRQGADTNEDSWEKLVNASLKDIQNKLDNDFTAIFETLEDKLDNTNISSYIDQFEVIQSEIDSETKIKVMRFQQVKDSIPNSSIINLKLLKNKTYELLQQVKNALEYISKYIN